LDDIRQGRDVVLEAARQRLAGSQVIERFSSFWPAF
jgi:hypothetical protein